MCEPIVQAREAMNQMIKESRDNKSLLDYKYNPEEYHYAESEGAVDVLSEFREVQLHLRSNGLDFEKYKAMDDIDEMDEM